VPARQQAQRVCRGGVPAPLGEPFPGQVVPVAGDDPQWSVQRRMVRPRVALQGHEVTPEAGQDHLAQTGIGEQVSGLGAVPLPDQVHELVVGQPADRGDLPR
jgi:hypothetical protein